MAEDRKQYVEEWQKENLKRVVIKLNKTKDADIIRHLQRVNDDGESTQTYVKRLIREDME